MILILPLKATSATDSKIEKPKIEIRGDSNLPKVSDSDGPSGFHYPFQSSVSLNVGGISFFSATAQPEFVSMASISVLWTSMDAFHIETGAEAVTSQNSQLWAAGHWKFSSFSRFRPHLSAGFGVRTSARSIVSILLPHSLFLRLAAGFELSVSSIFFIRTELISGIDNKAPLLAGGTIGFGVGI